MEALNRSRMNGRGLKHLQDIEIDMRCVWMICMVGYHSWFQGLVFIVPNQSLVKMQLLVDPYIMKRGHHLCLWNVVVSSLILLHSSELSCHQELQLF
jgi:hypothetical protein